MTLLLLAGLVLALALSAISSGAETGTYCVNRVRLRVRAEQGDRGARRLARMLDRPEDLVIATLTGTNVADYLASAFAVALLVDLGAGGARAELYATALLTPLVLVFGGIIPKDWFRREADRLMYALAAPLDWTIRALRGSGLLWLLRSVTTALLRRVDPRQADQGDDALPRARMRRLLIEGAASGGLTRMQRESIERVLRLSQLRVGNVMVPRARAAIVSDDVSRADLLRIVRMAHFSRLPVSHGDPNNVVGMINVYDVLFDADERPPREHLRDILRVQPHESAATALLRLQQLRQVMACVVDRRGRCVGLFTIKDLVRRILSEIGEL